MSAKPPSQATILVELVRNTADLELFHNCDGDGYVTIPAGTHAETWPLRSRQVRQWLSRIFFECEATTPGSAALKDALLALEGMATHRGEEREVHLRIAGHAGDIYLDLVDAYWHCVHVTSSGWEVVADAPVRFKRSRGMRALPFPVRGGSIDELREFVNVHDEDWPLVAAWTVAALRPRGPFPLLALHGEQGSAKSTTLRVLRQLVDPNVAELRSEPREGRDLMIAAQNSWVCAFDNMSAISSWLSDGLCRLSTGGGFATRQLFTDADELLIDAMRPIAFNGIQELATRGDLLDRALVLYLPRISRRRTEEELWAAFELARPRILGALLDALVTGLANIETVKLEHLPRMADFARFSVAAEPALGCEAGAFLDAYSSNRAAATDLTLEASPIVEPLRTLVAAGPFTGTASELLQRLAGLVDDEVVRKKTWPAAANVLSGMLRRLAPNLRTTGIDVEIGRRDAAHGRRRLVTVRTVPETTVQTVRIVHPARPSDDPDDPDGLFRHSEDDDVEAEMERLLRKHGDLAEESAA